MTDRYKAEARAEAGKQLRKGEPYAADEILIMDYVMLDFADEPAVPWQSDRSETTAQRWHHD